MAKKITKNLAKSKTALKKIITVKNADGDPDTTAEILIQNKIKYTPKVSVIIPVYNVEQYLRECLDSVVNQTLREIEIICVDDGSTDSSLDILKEYASKDNRITVITQKNLHAGVARNAGLAVARGEYVHFCDSDDWVEKEIYTECLKKIADIILFDAFKTDISLNKKLSWKKDYLNKEKIKGDINEFEFKFCTGSPWGKLFRRTFINKHKIRFQNLKCCNDIYFVKLALVVADSIELVDRPLYNWRFNAQGNTSSSRGKYSECIVAFAKQIYSTLEKLNLLNKYEELLYQLCVDAFAYEYSQCVFEKRQQQMESYKKFLPHKYLSNLIEKVTPEISVIIPVYNASDSIAKTLDSLLLQTFTNFEIIAVNDGSTDTSLDILNLYKRKDHRVQVLNQNNSGAGSARNNGINIARGKYITFLDSDDFCEHNMLEEYHKIMKETDADIAVSKFYKYSIKEQKIVSTAGHYAKKGLYNTTELGEDLFTISLPMPWNKIFKKQLLEKNNITFPNLKSSEDICFCYSAFAHAQKIAFIDKTFVFWTYDNTKSLHFTSGNKNLEDAFLTFVELQKQLNASNLYTKHANAFVKAFASSCKWLITNFCSNTKSIFNTIRKYIKLLELEKYPYWNKFINNLIKTYEHEHEIIISLTSYPARIGTINQTIESLLNQTMKADKVILWLAPEQFPNREGDLPQQLLDLCNKGLTIDWYHDIRSYKKLIPTLKKYPDALIVTADDDLLYEPTWLEELHKGYLKYPNDINIHRATKFYRDATGFRTIAGGREYWPNASVLNKITGGAGALYPPKCFYKDVLDEELIMKLAPTNDDQWFWIQCLLNNKKIRVVDKPQWCLHYIPGTQETGLCKVNDAGPKLFWRDFRALMNYYPQVYNMLKTEADKHTLNRPVSIPYFEDFSKSNVAKKVGLNFVNTPKTYNEKIQWLKLFASTPDKTRLADKYLVRDWVAEKIGEKYLIPLLGAYDSFEEINFKKLPKRFVIKCNHGCGYNIIVKDKSKLDLNDVKSKLDKWMNENFAFRAGCELHYRDIPPKIIIEKYIENKKSIGGDLYDYKFWCFDGRVHYIQFLSERNTDGLKMAFYDRKWKKQNFVYSYPLDTKTIERPDNLYEMIELAEKLSAGFNHVRVDFYRMDDGTIYFGEMTFTSASGTCKWNDEKINRYFGKLIKLPKLAYNIDTGEYYKLPKIKKQKKDKKEKQQKKKLNLKPYLLFPYYLIAMVFMKYIKIPVLKFVKHTKQIWYSHSHRGKMDMLNKNFTNIMQSVTSVKNDMTNQITQIKNQQSNLEKQIADLRHTTGVKSNDLSQQIADFQSSASQSNDALAQKIIDLNTVTKNKSNDLSQQIADFQSSASQSNDALAQKIIDLNTVTENKSNDLSQQIADFQSNASQSNDALVQKIIDLINTTNGIPDTIAQHASEQIKAIQHNVETLNQQIKDTQSNIINTVDQIKKYADELTVMNSEPYWAHVYHDTTANTTWLKNKSVSPGRWAISYIVLYVLYRILDEAKPKSILECGLGQSSKLTIQYADSHNVDLTICENNPEWLSFFQRQFPTADKYTTILDTEMVNIVPEHESRTYANFKQTIGNKKFNLVLIDGPLGSPHYSRPEVLDIVDNLDKSFVILLDDMNRIGEQETWQLLKQKLHSKSIEFKERKYSSDKTVGLICSTDLAYLTSL